jgi:beta-lactamase class D
MTRFKMTSFLLFFVFGLSLSCSSMKNSNSVKVEGATETANQDPLLQNSELSACFLLYDLKNQKFVSEFNPQRCKQRQAPASTFKVPLAAMAFDDGVLEDEKTQFKWDGEKHSIESWNKDHTSATWMRDSVVWYSQILTQKMGRKKVQSYLDKFNYGNKDMSGHIKNAWLTPSPSNPDVSSSIAINGYEQIEFMKKLWTQKLPVSEKAHELTQKIMFLEKSPKGFRISGKTGSGYVDPETNRRLGWYVTHIKGNDQEYLSVFNFHDLNPQKKPEFASALAKKMTKEFLVKQGIY